MLNLQLNELQRQIEVTRKQMPKMPEYAEQILSLQQELAMEREMTELLCRDLETPKNLDRWREIPGDEPDVEQLDTRIHLLEERVNNKKEQLLEKELVLEEVTSLSDKLRKQASEGRADTLRLAKRVNEFQSRIKDTTRKMMATVSELSMYQATAIKLQQVGIFPFGAHRCFPLWRPSLCLAPIQHVVPIRPPCIRLCLNSVFPTNPA